MDNGRIVQPRTRKEVEALAGEARAALNLSSGGRVSMLPILEDVLFEVLDDYDFRIVEDKAMRSMEGLTDDRQPIIYLRNSVYNALERGDGRARMTAAHEFGHLLMHCGMPTFRAFSEQYEPLYDPERQANIFAAAFLMPKDAFLKCVTVREAMKTFGVSQDAAMCRARTLNHRLKLERPILTVTKKKGISKRQSP